MDKTTIQCRVNTTRYLDEDGLKDLWKKIKEYVAEHSIEIDGDNIDFSNYVTTEQLEDALANIDTSDIDLSAYATKGELTNTLFDYATKEYIDNAIQGVDVNPGVYIGTDEPADEEYSVWIDTDDNETAKLDNFYTKEEINKLLDAYALKAETLTEEQVNILFDNKLGVIENGTY